MVKECQFHYPPFGILYCGMLNASRIRISPKLVPDFILGVSVFHHQFDNGARVKRRMADNRFIRDLRFLLERLYADHLGVNPSDRLWISSRKSSVKSG